LEIHASARKHGIADEDIRDAIDHALAIEDAGEDPDVGSSSARIVPGTYSRLWFSSRSRALNWQSTQ
jgi:hypothetical protein